MNAAEATEFAAAHALEERPLGGRGQYDMSFIDLENEWDRPDLELQVACACRLELLRAPLLTLCGNVVVWVTRSPLTSCRACR